MTIALIRSLFAGLLMIVLTTSASTQQRTVTSSERASSQTQRTVIRQEQAAPLTQPVAGQEEYTTPNQRTVTRPEDYAPIFYVTECHLESYGYQLEGSRVTLNLNCDEVDERGHSTFTREFTGNDAREIGVMQVTIDMANQAINRGGMLKLSVDEGEYQSSAPVYRSVTLTRSER